MQSSFFILLNEFIIAAKIIYLASKFTKEKFYCSFFSAFIFTSSNSFLDTILILYPGYLVFHHLLIEIATPSKSWAQILTHKILVSTSLKNSQLVGDAIINCK